MVEKVTGSIFTRYEKSARSQQGMAIWRDEAFLYYHGGSCDVMDLKEKKIVDEEEVKKIGKGLEELNKGAIIATNSSLFIKIMLKVAVFNLLALIF